MNALTYLLQVNIYLVLFLGFYWIALKNETFFKPNRIYLISTAVLSFLIPFLSLDLFRDLVITETVREISMVPMEVVYQPVIIASEPSGATPADVLTWIYLTGAGFFLARLLVRLYGLRKAIRNPQNTAFSFFGILSVAPELEQRDTILQHEQVHARQWHSFDVLLMEILAVINWFNPVTYLYRTEIRHIHEFIADEESSRDSKETYAMLLLSNTFGIPAHQLTNSFFNQSLLKRRIHMLSKHRSQRTKLLKYGLCAPIFSFMLILSSAAVSRQASELADTGSDLITRAEARKSNNDFLKRNPAVRGVRWSAGGTVLEIFLKNGKTERYDLANADEMEKLTTAYGTVPVPPPAAASEDTIPAGSPEDYEQFLKNNPEVERVGWRNRLVIITLKSGRSESYDLDNEAAMKTARNKYGKLPAAPPPPPQRSNTGNASQQDDLYNFASVEQLPKFPGGDEQFGKFLAGNLKYPAEAKEKHISGRVFVSFVVEKDGSLTDIKVLRGLGYGTDEEAVRVLKASPKWSPGMKEGKKVRVQFTMPIFFQLGEPEQHAAEDQGNPGKAFDFASVEQLPKFPGGDAGFSEFLSENIRYPSEAKAKNIQGKVFAQFTVETDGSLSGIKIVRGLGAGTEEETLRVLKLSPRWIPGTNDGKPVRVSYTIPIDYQLAPTWNPAILKDKKKLFVLNGNIVSAGELEKLEPHQIRAINVLDAAEAKKQYGKKGRNGAVLITTKNN